MSTARELPVRTDRLAALADGAHVPASRLGAEADRAEAEEALVPDVRAHVRPAQQVENKLMSLLKNAPLPVSHVRLTTLANQRSHC